MSFNRFWKIDYPTFVGNLLSDLNLTENDLILDIATGTSYIPLFLSRNHVTFKKIVGLDITFGMLGEGKNFLKAERIADRVPQVCASALEMPFKSNVYDIAICCLATHHMDVELLLSNIMHALKPGGKVYLADAGACLYLEECVGQSIAKRLGVFLFPVSGKYFKCKS